MSPNRSDVLWFTDSATWDERYRDESHAAADRRIGLWYAAAVSETREAAVVALPVALFLRRLG
jgi:hypothetical protein